MYCTVLYCRSNIRERWNSKMSLKTNMKRLGLVYDINSDIRPYKKAEKMVIIYQCYNMSIQVQ